jgi:hypothetical protein
LVTAISIDRERRLQKEGVFENKALKRIFGPKGKEVTGKWRKLQRAFTIFTLLHVLLGYLNQVG